MVGRPRLFEDMALFRTGSGDHWLLPGEPGPCIALEIGGPRISCSPPFADAHERAAGVTAAAAWIIRTVRAGEWS